MKRNLFNTVKVPKWPIINLKTMFSLMNVYLSGYWSWYGQKEISFIKKFSKLHTVKYVITSTSATVGIENALIALGIKQGDEVIVPAYTWISTATAVARIGAIPVIVDIEPDTLCISPKAIRSAITDKTKAVIPVHLFSATAEMCEIMDIAKEYNLKVVEDCAHAHGAMYDGKGVGSIGDVGVFSFQQVKLMCSGEGGACITNDREVADTIDRINHIGYSVYSKKMPGTSQFVYSKNVLSEFQLAVLDEQCDMLLSQTVKREENAQYLENLLNDIDGVTCQKTSKATTRRSYCDFVFMIDSSRLKEDKSIYNIIFEINKYGLKAKNGWGIPIYEHEAWNLPEELYIKKNTEIAEQKSKKEVVTLPQTILLTDKKNLKKVANIVRKVVSEYIS